MLAAMVFAVAMTFIDQTIVAIAIPEGGGGWWPFGVIGFALASAYN
jgi:hypothetical protein